MSDYILGLALISLLWGIVSAIVMAAYVSNKGQKISLLFFRMYVLKYIYQYSKIPTEENGDREFGSILSLLR